MKKSKPITVTVELGDRTPEQAEIDLVEELDRAAVAQSAVPFNHPDSTISKLADAFEEDDE